MSILLFGAGAVAFVAGLAMIGFGIPINEFSFGNTLIVSGTTAMVGGFIVAGLGAAVSQLQRIAEALGTRPSVRAGRSVNSLEPGAVARIPAGQSRIPFPPKQKSEPKTDAGRFGPNYPEARAEAPLPSGSMFNDPGADYFAPALHNPDEPPVTVEDEVSLSPRHPLAASARPTAEFYDDDGGMDDPRNPPPAFDVGRRPQGVPAPGRPAPTAYFESMWPPEPKSPEPRSSAPRPVEPRPVGAKPAGAKPPVARSASAKSSDIKPFDIRPAAEPAWDVGVPDAESKPQSSDGPELDAGTSDETRGIAILKSGVVDGMGYTLYVDGSIEAELPQGTLRFASINDLRRHLEKAS